MSHRPRALASLAACAMLLSTGVMSTMPVHAAPADSFWSSFETDDVQPVTSPDTSSTTNFTGDLFPPTSLLGLVTDAAGTGNSPGAEGPENAADGNPGSKWLTFAATGDLTYTLSESAAITGYSITSANDAPERDPKDFVVQGSVDGTTWVDLDSQTGQSWAADGADNRFITKTYTLDAESDAYQHYRLSISANQSGNIIQLAGWNLINENRTVESSPMSAVVSDGPRSSHTAKTRVGWTGVGSLAYSGRVVADGPSSATTELYDVDVTVADGAALSYKIFPTLDKDQTYSATHVAVDLVFSDGSQLSTSGARDVYGFEASARGQGQGKILWPDQWNSVTVPLGAFAGKTIDKILLTYDQPEAVADAMVSGWIDDISIDTIAPRDTSDGLISYVDTRRGSNSSGGYSRGNNFPAVAVPNGFNFITPMTNASTTGTLYAYQRDNNADNLPELQGIGFSHQPSIWMGDRNQLVMMPADGDAPTSNLRDRSLAFKHENEVARPDVYRVEFEDGIVAETTPTDHGGVFRFSFTGDRGSVIVDRGVGESGLTVAADGTVSGWIHGGSGYPGRTRMFVAGQFDATPTAAGKPATGDRDGAQYAAFDTSSDKTVELRVATSFISQDQARRNLDLELTGRTFEDVQTVAKDAWNDRLAVITDIEGADDHELVNVYSGLYRLNLYPNSQFENVGTAESPKYQYASPVSPTEGEATATHTNAKIVDGKIYVNNGFWDTYRTAWPMYAMFYPELAPELVDGFVQQYRDGGWIARWSSPGYADLMTGTSSDVSFAEAYLTGSLDTALALDAYDAALRNATAAPESNAVGRKGLERSIFLGFTEETTHESASWGLEGYINDFGIAKMAAALAQDPETPAERVQQLQEEAAYFSARAEHYVEMYNPAAGTFTARSADGSWPVGEDFDKKAWGGAFTEASGWTFAFHAPHDVDGLAALYGGRRGLLAEFEEFFSTPELADRSGIHEAREARDVRMGMLGLSNQIAHHIPYVYVEAGGTSEGQAIIREATDRLFAGSDIGQGYPGDEDNGEFSAWYIFSSLGLYPLEVGSGNYTIGSPRFDKATIHMGDKSLTIEAPGASSGKKYVAGLSHDGVELDTTTIDGQLLRDGGTLSFTMSDQPSDWGAKDLDEALSVPFGLVDVNRPELAKLTSSDGKDVAALQDDHMRTNVAFAGTSTQLDWESLAGPVTIHQYTLTNATEAGSSPVSWTLSGSNDGEEWVELDSREDQQFRWDLQTRPFSVAATPQAFTHHRLVIEGSGDQPLAMSEVELFSSASTVTDLMILPVSDLKARAGEELSATLANIVGGDFTGEYSATVDFGDGTEPVEATLERNRLGGQSVRATHVFEKPGVYTALVTVVDSNGETATGKVLVSVSRDVSWAGSLNNVCIGDVGQTAANCDGQNHGYPRDRLAEAGFVQGETVTIPGTELTFDLPKPAPGQPDNVTGEGQTIAIDLGEGATQVSFIGSATEAGRALEATLTFSDGSTQQVPMAFGDWVGAAVNPAYGNTVVASTKGRLSGTSLTFTDQSAGIFATQPVAIDTDDAGAPKKVVSLTMPKEEGTLRSDGRVHVFAVASDGTRTEAVGLDVTPAEVPAQMSGEQFTATLATVVAAEGRELSAMVNWGDGTPAEAVDVTDMQVQGTHTYAEPGTYTVWVTVDDGVRSATVSLEITVEGKADAPALREALQRAIDAGLVGERPAKHLLKAATAAEQHALAGRTKIALKEIDRFIGLLEHPKKKDVITPEARDELLALAKVVRASLA